MPVRKLMVHDPPRLTAALCLLLRYSEDVMADTSARTDRHLKGELFDSERACMLALLAIIGEADAEIMDAESSPLQRTLVLSRVVGYAQSLCIDINDTRATRRSAFLSSFPTVHWLLLGVLGLTIPSLFIVLASTSKGATVELLSDELIRVLFASLVGSIVGLLVLLADLNDPFAGNYRVRDGDGFEEPRQQIYRLLAELEADEPGLRQLQEKLMALTVESPEAVSRARAEPSNG